jgi:TPR repeat protein
MRFLRSSFAIAVIAFAGLNAEEINAPAQPAPRTNQSLNSTMSPAIPATQPETPSDSGKVKLYHYPPFSLSGLKISESEQVAYFHKISRTATTPIDMYMTGLLYEEGQGVSKDDKAALQWYQKSAALGGTLAMIKIGQFYSSGRGGLKEDHGLEMQWYEKAVAFGDPQALTEIGIYHQNREGNYSSAMEWYQKAAIGGNPDAMYCIGFNYENGWGVDRNVPVAITWYQKSATQGSTDAQKALERLGVNFTPTTLILPASVATPLIELTKSGMTSTTSSVIPQDDEQSHLQEGKTLEDRRDFNGAIIEYNKAIEMDPKDPTAYENRASAKRKNDDDGGAISDYGKAIEINPTDVTAYKARASAKEMVNDIAGAISDYSKAIEINPKDATAYEGRGWEKLTWGYNPAAAIPDFTQAIALNPNDAEAYSGRASSKIDLGNLDGGIEDYNEAITLNPNDTTSYNGRAKAELAERKFNSAISDCTHAISLSLAGIDMGLDLFDSYIGRGKVKFAQSDYDGAIADFNLALGCKVILFPGAAYHQRGLAKSLKGNIDGALADYDLAIQSSLDSKLPATTILFETYADRGYENLLKGDNDGAISDENAAIAYYTKGHKSLRAYYLEDIEETTYCAAAYNCSGIARQRNKDLSGATTDFSKAIELSKEYAEAFYNRGLVENAQRMFDAAISDFSKVIEIDPKNAEAYSGRGYANYYRKEFSQAYINFRKAADLGSVRGQRMVGLFYLTGTGVSKNYGESFKWYQRAAYQGDAESQYRSGQLYFNGAGVAKDQLEALAWVNIAAATGKQDFLRFRAYLEYILGQQAALIAQQRSKEILQSIRAEKEHGVTAESAPQAGDQPNATGTGVFITNDGAILTAAHVVKGARAIKVVTQQGIKVATVTSIDIANDVALLHCDGTFQAVPIKDSGSIKLGQSVFTIGFPDVQLQGFSPKMTRGEISSETGIQDDPRDWQISVPVQPGNSGGPLFDEEGNVIGIVVAKLDAAITAKVTGALPEDVNYAVKSSYALVLLQPSQQHLLPDFKPPNTPDKIEDVVGRVQNSVVLILVY